MKVLLFKLIRLTIFCTWPLRFCDEVSNTLKGWQVMLLFFRGLGEAKGCGKASELENFCHNCIYLKVKILHAIINTANSNHSFFIFMWLVKRTEKDEEWNEGEIYRTKADLMNLVASFLPVLSTGIVQKCITPHIHNLGYILFCVSLKEIIYHILWDRFG